MPSGPSTPQAARRVCCDLTLCFRFPGVTSSAEDEDMVMRDVVQAEVGLDVLCEVRRAACGYAADGA